MQSHQNIGTECWYAPYGGLQVCRRGVSDSFFFFIKWEENIEIIWQSINENQSIGG